MNCTSVIYQELKGTSIVGLLLPLLIQELLQIAVRYLQDRFGKVSELLF